MKLQRITSARDSWPNRNHHEIKLEGGYIFCHQLSSESVPTTHMLEKLNQKTQFYRFQMRK